MTRSGAVLLEEIEPFIGWLAQVPDLKRRVREVLEQGDA